MNLDPRRPEQSRTGGQEAVPAGFGVDGGVMLAEAAVRLVLAGRRPDLAIWEAIHPDEIDVNLESCWVIGPYAARDAAAPRPQYHAE